MMRLVVGRVPGRKSLAVCVDDDEKNIRIPVAYFRSDSHALIPCATNGVLAYEAGIMPRLYEAGIMPRLLDAREELPDAP